jgi:hypothetical protein
MRRAPGAQPGPCLQAGRPGAQQSASRTFPTMFGQVKRHSLANARPRLLIGHIGSSIQNVTFRHQAEAIISGEMRHSSPVVRFWAR